MKKLFSTIVISALLCVNTFATPVVVNSKPATFEKTCYHKTEYKFFIFT